MIKFTVMLNGEWFHDEVGNAKTAKPSLMTKQEVCQLITMISFKEGSVLNIYTHKTSKRD